MRMATLGYDDNRSSFNRYKLVYMRRVTKNCRYLSCGRLYLWVLIVKHSADKVVCVVIPRVHTVIMVK